MLRITAFVGAFMLLTVSHLAVASGYVGIGVGKTDYDVPTFDDPTGIELILGTKINENLALEASFIDFGESSDHIPPEWRIDGNSIAFGVLGIMPASETVDLFVKIGMHMWDLELTEDGFGLLAQDDGQDIFFGFGATVQVNNKFSLGARYNSYDVDGDDVTRLSVNAQIGF